MLGDGYHDVPAGKVAVVVTHLEMTSPAPLRGAGLPDGLTFAPLARDLATYRDLFSRVGAPWLWFGRLVKPDADLDAIISDPQVDLFTLLKDGTPEAILELNFRDKGACELAYFGLTDKLIGTGAGAFLMDQAIKTAWSHEISRLHLHTCTMDSPQALSFYIRSGFTPVRRQVEIADDPRTLGLYPDDTGAHYPQL